MRRISLIPVHAVIGVTLLTALIVTLGPTPVVPTTSSTVTDPSALLTEPRDRYVLVAWWLFTAVLAVVTLWRVDRAAKRRHAGSAPTAQLIDLALSGGAACLVVAAIMWKHDPTGIWGGIPWRGVVAGLFIAAGVIWLLRTPRRPARPVVFAVLLAVLVFAVPAWLQLPGGVRDPYHFQFTSDEVTAVGAGHFPLVDYIPQYTTLLGFPLAPLLHLWPHQAAFLGLTWLLMLQGVAIAAAVLLPVLQGGRRMWAPSLVVVLIPSLATTLTGTAASTYFAALPLRVVLPALTILLAYLVIRHRPVPSLRRPMRWLALGLMSGIAVLNNPDYGLPVLATVLVVVIIAIDGRRERLLSVCLVLIAAAATFVAYGLLGAATHHPVHWSYWLSFQTIFGTAGYMAVAMDRFGLHVAIVSLFAAASAVGFVLVRRSMRRGGHPFAYQQGVLLCLTGGWSLLTLPYFSGRSLAPTAVVGYAYAVGLVTASMLPLIRASYRIVRSGAHGHDRHAAIGLGMGVLAIAGATSGVVLFWSPAHYLARLDTGHPLAYSVLTDQSQAVFHVADDPNNSTLRDALANHVVEQALPMSALTGLVDGIPSAAVVSATEYYDLSRSFTTAHCSRPWDDGTDYLLVLPKTADSFASDPSCGAHFDLPGRETFTDGTSTFVLLPRPKLG